MPQNYEVRNGHRVAQVSELANSVQNNGSARWVVTCNGRQSTYKTPEGADRAARRMVGA